MRIHVLGLPHTQTTEEFTTCAFTQKALNLCKMMHRRGHHVIHYGVEIPAGQHPECSEHVDVMSAAQWEKEIGRPGTAYYNIATDGKLAPYHALFAKNMHAALAARTGAPDTEIVCQTWGGAQVTACTGIEQHMVESGIGYPISWADWRVYESYAWMHMHLGRDQLFGGKKWYWAVIPNAFDLKNFRAPPYGPRGEDFLYLGRLNDDKGVGIAIQVAKEVGRKIVIVGQGDPQPFLAGNPHARYMKPVGVEKRRELLANARAVFCLTQFVEPFCGVNVEAQLSGTPVITSDHGVFCVPLEAKILTKRGWLTRDEVRAGQDETLGYHAETGENRWTTITAVNTFKDQQTEQYRNRNWTVRVTKDHRWVALKAKHVTADHHEKIRTLASIESLRNSVDSIRLSAEACGGDLETTERQAAILAWFLTDGSLEKYGWPETSYGGKFNCETDDLDALQRARIYQSKPEGLAILRALLKDVPHEETERPRVQPTHLPQHVFSIPVDVARKIIRACDIRKRGLFGFLLGLSRKAREAFLNACIEAEGGHASKGSTIVLAQNEGPVLEAMRLCAYLCGHRPSLQKTDEKCKPLSLCNPLMTPTALHREPGRIEDVWCPTTELGSWTMMFGDEIMLTGNSETVLHGVTGFRGRTFEQWVWAAKNIDQIDGRVCREWAEANYSLERVALMYEEFFQQVLNVRNNRGQKVVGPTGFYERHPGRTQLDWLVRKYPQAAADSVIDLTRPHEAPVVAVVEPTVATSQSEWQEAQVFESDWWGLDWSPRWDEELKKQETYHRLMGITVSDFGTNRILDVGCGPVSLLQRTKHGPSRGVDPLRVSDDTRARYREAGVELLSVPAEEMPTSETFDEVWLYNCLQHTRDPHEILRRVVQCTAPGSIVRIFEWIETGVAPGHPQNLTESLFVEHFRGATWSQRIWNVGTVSDVGGSAEGKYIALAVERR